MSLITGQQTVTQTDAVLLFSGQTGANASVNIGPSIDTTGFASLVWEIVSNGTFQMTVETSNDQNTWVTLWSLPLSEVAQVDTINQNGHYAFDVDARYMRYNIAFASNTINHTVYGRSSSPSSAVDRLSVALDQTNNIALSVAVVNQKKDNFGALVPSDAISYNTFLGGATTNAIFDTTGYNSITIQQIGGGASAVTISNDGLNWFNTIGVNLATGAQATALAAGAIFAFPCAARYLRVQGTATSGQIVAYLRTNPIPGNNFDLTGVGGTAVASGTAQLGINAVQVGGTAVVTGGIAGTFGVAGAVATNSGSTAQNPVQVGTTDAAGVMRRFVVVDVPTNVTTANANNIPTLGGAFGNTFANTANVGFLATTGVAFDQANTIQKQTVVTGMSSPLQTPAMPIIDLTSAVDGSGNKIELLQQILKELQILNHYIHELPLLLNNGIVNALDEPHQLRQEDTLFTTQPQ